MTEQDHGRGLVSGVVVDGDRGGEHRSVVAREATRPRAGASERTGLELVAVAHALELAASHRQRVGELRGAGQRGLPLRVPRQHLGVARR